MSQRADAWVSLVVGAALSVGGLFFLVGEVATDRDLTQRGTRGPAVVVAIEHHRRAPNDAVVEIVATGTRADLVLDQWGPDPRASERVDVLYDPDDPTYAILADASTFGYTEGLLLIFAGGGVVALALGWRAMGRLRPRGTPVTIAPCPDRPPAPARRPGRKGGHR